MKIKVGLFLELKRQNERRKGEGGKGKNEEPVAQKNDQRNTVEKKIVHLRMSDKSGDDIWRFKL